MTTRRQFLRSAALIGASFFAPGILGFPYSDKSIDAVGTRVRRLATYEMPTLDPTTIPKFMTPLVIPPVMPVTAMVKQRGGAKVEYYEIGVRQFQQQILPDGFPDTTVWGYGSVNHPGSFNYPSFTIEARHNRAVRVKWINDLVDADGNYLPHLLPVDPTLHWANPPGGLTHRDGHTHFHETPGPYTGPVPIVTHVHGAHVSEESDGYAEAWFLPNAANIPEGYARTGTFYDYFKPIAENKYNQNWDPGSAVFQYTNDQPATTLWYHDHALGITRLNVYAGPAGFYLIRGGRSDIKGNRLPGPAPATGDPAGKAYYEIPMAIQDRSFNADGSLFFPDSRAFFDEYEGPYIPETEVPPIWNPEFFGNTMLVNGKTWPSLTVEPRRYRFRLLNGCNSRFIILKLVVSGKAHDPRPVAADLPFWQIGAEGGFLAAPVQLEQILLAPAERADVIVDFTNMPEGTELVMINEGPDDPFGGGMPGVDFDPADPETTGQVMRFVVGPLQGKDKSMPVDRLKLPDVAAVPAASVLRSLSLNEMMSMDLEEEIPVAATLGTIDDSGEPVSMMWGDPISENPAVGSVEIWEMHNFTMDAHPIHIHQVMFQVVDRVGEDGVTRPPEPWESGLKDTVIAFPGEITRVRAYFDLPGLYVWHCHIVDHEDNEMMRPFHVGPIPPDLPH
jgi:spore coat protein A, manganese oxidase